MRITNDRIPDGEQPQGELNLVNMLSHGMLCAIGIATLVFAPVPMILAHIRLSEPWPKVSVLLGAVIALLLLEAPLFPVLFAFSIGLFAADAVCQEKDIWKLLASVIGFAAVLGFLGIFVQAQLEGASVGDYWVGLIDGVMEQFKTSIKGGAELQLDLLRAMLLNEGPFLYLSAVLLSLWLSIGVAAHFEWFEAPHAYSAEKLRTIRLPVWASVAFVAVFGVVMFASPEPGLLGGIFRLAAVLMFMQGSICISHAMKSRAVAPRARTLVYSVALVLGFYAVVGLGVLAPWFFRRQEMSNFRFKRTLEEGT